MTNPAEAASGRLAWEMESWRSIEFRMHQEIVPHPAGEGVSNKGRIDEHYIETAGGQRLLESCSHIEGYPERLHVSFADGERFADEFHAGGIGSRQTEVRIKRAFSTEGDSGGVVRSWPLSHFYVNKLPLQRALPRATYLGSEPQLGRDCDTFLFTQVKFAYRPLDVVYWLDRETGIPLKIAAYLSEQDRREGRQHLVWRAESLDEVEGRHMPLQSVSETYTPAGEIAESRKFVIDELHYDREYPASMFWPRIEPGAQVNDLVAKKSFVVQGAKEVAKPITAEPPRDWTPAYSAVGLGLGLAVLAAGLLVWRHRH